NHLTILGLQKSLEELGAYTSAALGIFHDLIRHNGRNQIYKKSEGIGALIAKEQEAFRNRCEEIAGWIVKGYQQDQWKSSQDGVYCIVASKTARFDVVNPHKDVQASCNPLETGFVISLQALNAMTQHKNTDIAHGLSLYRDYLMGILDEQRSQHKSLIDADKILNLLSK